jgi:putative DNA primase/helicase
MLQSVFDHAIFYSKLGFAVLPLHFPNRNHDQGGCSCGITDCKSPAKHPVAKLVPSGLKNATADQDVIERWFRNQPWNIGLVTGNASGIVALDVDPRHEGDSSVVALEKEHGLLPKTWRFLTGGGGQHILYRHPGAKVQNSVGRLGVGVDVRGDGGFIVAPPSIHISGRPYAISVDHHPHDIPLADLPGWLIEVVKSDAKVGASAEEWREQIGAMIPEGQRNDSLTRITGHLLSHGIEPHVCLEIILSLNMTHCNAPLPEQEILTIVASITRREFARRATRRKEANRG